jgi:RimJ/RimL family protein N-acetyltransferase
MAQRPTIETERLTLRPFALSDAPEVQRLAGSWEVADTTLNIPHPYEDGMAEQWIATHQPSFERGELVNFAIVHRAEGYLVGAVGLTLTSRFDRAEIGYWVGVPYWNRGYCTEAAKAVVAHGFRVLGLNRVMATHLTRNLASGRVMQKIGMTHEGRMRQHVKRWDRYEDLEMYAILRSEHASADA